MITLIGEDLAQIGLTFVFDGPAKPCENCRFKASCIDSLEKGRKYTITDVKDITQKCEVHDGGIVKAVRVELADVEGLIDSKKVFEGSNISYLPPECDEECIYHHLCFPEGLVPEDKCVIIKNLGKHSVCAKGYSLTKVSLRLNL